MDKRQFRDTIRATESSALMAAVKIMDAGVRETQSQLSIIRRELKRRKRAEAANTAGCAWPDRMDSLPDARIAP